MNNLLYIRHKTMLPWSLCRYRILKNYRFKLKISNSNVKNILETIMKSLNIKRQS